MEEDVPYYPVLSSNTREQDALLEFQMRVNAIIRQGYTLLSVDYFPSTSSYTVGPVHNFVGHMVRYAGAFDSDDFASDEVESGEKE